MTTGKGECLRCGRVVPLNDIVRDGYRRGLLVCKECYDAPHPQDRPPAAKGERQRTPAPEISVPDDEGDEAPAIGFDESGRLTFT